MTEELISALVSAAGTTVTREVKKETFVIGRVKQQESETLKKRFIPWRKKGEKHA